MPGCNIESAALRAEDLRRQVEQLTVRYGEGTLPRVTISIGASSFPSAGTTPTDVLKAADDALYRAKDQGRNCVVVSEARRLSAVAQPIAEAAHLAA